jgi:hypothetical protein
MNSLPQAAHLNLHQLCPPTSRGLPRTIASAMPSHVGKGSRPGTMKGKPALILKGGNQSKQKLPVQGEMAADTAVAGTPKDRGPSKAARPQGTSPTARDTAHDDELDVQPLDIGLDNNEDASGTKDDWDSVARVISSTRKELFASALSKASTTTARSTRSWKPITPKDTVVQAEGRVRVLPSPPRQSFTSAHLPQRTAAILL